MVRAKFRVNSKTETEYGKDTRMVSVALSPVCANYIPDPANPGRSIPDPSHENTKFWQASPSGKIELGTINKAAADQLELGKEYYIDFTPAS